MKRTFWTAATACAVATLTGGFAFAAPPPTPTVVPFDTATPRQLVVRDKVLFDVVFDAAAGTLTTVKVGQASVTYNAIGFDTNDGFVYGIATANNHLLRIGKDGTAQDLGLPDGLTTEYPTLSQGVIPGSGPFAGHLLAHSFAADDATEHQLVDINIAAGTASFIELNATVPDVADLVWVGNALWGFEGARGKVWRIDPSAGTLTSFPAPAALPKVRFGGQWLYGNGNVGVVDNASGAVYQVKIDPATPKFTVVSKTPGSVSNTGDGASITGLPADLEVTATLPETVRKGDHLSYTVTVTNKGAGTSSGFVVSDAVPEGFVVTTAAGCDSSDPANLMCFGGVLGVGKSQDFDVELSTANAPVGELRSTVSVLGNEADPASSNNTAAQYTLVTTITNPTTKADAATIWYVDEDGMDLTPPVVLRGNIGDPYFSEAKTFPGYTLVKVPEDAVGEFQKGPQDVVYVYAKDATAPGTVTILFVDSDGMPIADHATASGTVGATYTSEPPEILGYELETIPANASGIITADATTVVYQYKALPQPLTVTHVDGDGEDVADPVTSEVNTGAQYSTAAQTVAGYTLKTTPENATGRMVAGGVNVEYVYTKVVAGAPVTVKFVDEAGKELAAPLTKSGNVGEAYASEAKAIPGYSLVTAPANGTGSFAAEAIMVVYVYKADPQDLTVRYVDSAGKDVAPADASKVATGAQYTSAPKTVDGYELTTIPANATGTMPAEQVTVTYVYKVKAAASPSATPVASASSSVTPDSPAAASGTSSGPTPVAAATGGLAMTGANIGIAAVVAVALIGTGTLLIRRRLNANN